MRHRQLFPEMHKKVPPGTSGDVIIDHFDVSEHESRMSAWRGGEAFVEAGRYCRLRFGEYSTVMTDTRHERITNLDVVLHAHGHVLIAGLGLGMILWPIVRKPEVKTVTVVEKNHDVIKLVGPHVPKRKVRIVHADIHTWRPLSHTFNCIYFDIWTAQSTDTLKEMTVLHRALRPYLDKTDPERWMDSWQRDRLRRKRREERTHAAQIDGLFGRGAHKNTRTCRIIEGA